MIIYVNPRTVSDSSTFSGPGWNTVNRTAESNVSLVDSDDNPIPITLSKPNQYESGDNGPSIIGSGDADWVIDPGITAYGWGANVGAPQQFKLENLDNNKKYRLVFFGSHEFSGRISSFSVNGLPPKTLDLENNTTDVVVFDDLVPDLGEMEIVFSADDSSSGRATLNAFFIEEIAGPSLTATNPPQGGEVFTFSGSNYAGQPTGPMTFTQGTRVISRAVTISNWNAEDGSFTGVTNTALPGVPAAGASDSPALLYGEPVTINLPDPGA